MNTTIADWAASSFSAAMTAADDPSEERGGGGIFRQNLTFSKFFNVSIPIGEKINIRYDDVNQNILENLNRFDILPPLPPSTNFALFLSSLVLAMIWVSGGEALDEVHGIQQFFIFQNLFFAHQIAELGTRYFFFRFANRLTAIS